MITRQMLRECHVFEPLNDANLDTISSMSVIKEYEAGATIFTEKSSAEEIYVVEKGKAALQMQLPSSQPNLNKKVTVDIVTQKEILGWSVLVSPYRYTLTAVCLEPTRVIAVNGVKLRSLIHDNQQIGYEVLSQLIKVVASRLDEAFHVLISERMMSYQGQPL